MASALETIVSDLTDRFKPDVSPTGGPVGDACLLVPASRIVEIARCLRDEKGFDLLADLTIVDYPDRDPRFEVVYNFYSLADRLRLFLKVRPQGTDPEVPTLTGLYGAADWFEREAWDMFGVRFAGHPNLVRILMYEAFEGHPLRKDYDSKHRQPLIGPRN